MSMDIMCGNYNFTKALNHIQKLKNTEQQKDKAHRKICSCNIYAKCSAKYEA
jgi:hypothetical protein